MGYRPRPAWKAFLSGLVEWSPVIAVISIVVVLAYLIVVGGGEPPHHQEFAKECALISGVVKKMNGITFCVDMQPVPDVVWLRSMSADEKYKVSHDCLSAGGQIFDYSGTDHNYGCYKVTIFEELGARDDYVSNN